MNKLEIDEKARERIRKIIEDFGILDFSYAALVYGLSKVFRFKPQTIIRVLEENGLPRTIEDLSKANPYFYLSASETLEEMYLSRRPLSCIGDFFPHEKRRNCYKDLVEHLQAS
ncbi:MAG: hypothetical protein QXX68_02640 [Candidatus Pacearchaeota archaeon]